MNENKFLLTMKAFTSFLIYGCFLQICQEENILINGVIIAIIHYLIDLYLVWRK